jgi:argininosuccinate lyase
VDTKLLDEAAVEYMGEPVGLDNNILAGALDPVQFIKQRKLYGGPAPEEAVKQIAEHRERIGEDEDFVLKKRSSIKEAFTELERAIDSLIGG